MSEALNPGDEPHDEAELARRLKAGYDAPQPRPQFVDSLAHRLHEEHRTMYQPAMPEDNPRPAAWLAILAIAAGVLIMVGVAVGAGTALWVAGSFGPAAPQDQAALPQEAAPPDQAAPPKPAIAPKPPISPTPAEPKATIADAREQEPASPKNSTPEPAVAESTARPSFSRPLPVNDNEPGSAAPASPAPKRTTAGEKLDAPLRYGWKVGQRYSYEFSIEGQIGNTTRHVAKGGINYTPDEVKQPEAVEIKVQEASGSGFLVDRQGHLITCAHVVTGATKVEADLNGMSYKAEVVALDNQHDLALLKIEAGDWATLPVADSAAVELGQDVRVVGYPLTDVLGRSIKVTRGTVAGIIDRNEGQRFQVDASVNAGNSGGPLINEAGQVVGVASAKLSGEEISNVGFAVPAARVMALLSANGVRLKTSPAADSLPGPELARRVTPAVALLRVTIGPGGVGIEPQVRLAYQGHLRTASKELGGGQPSSRIRFPSPPRFDPFGGIRRAPRFSSSSSGRSVKNEQGRITIDVKGEVHDSELSLNLPFVLGPQGLLVLDPLGDGQSQWSRQQTISIIRKKKEEDDSPFGPGFHRPRLFSPFGPAEPEPREEVASLTPALEQYDFELGETKADSVEIHRRYKLQTVKKESAEVDMLIEGEGTLIFNTKEGVPESLSWECQVTITQDNITVRIPVKLSYQRVEHDAVVASQRATINPSDPLEAPRSYTSHELDDLLEQISDKDQGRRWIALDKLKSAAPDKRRDDVAAALAAALASDDVFTRQRAIGALRVWHVAAVVPEVLKLLDHKDLTVRNNAIEVLGEYPSRESAEAIVRTYDERGISPEKGVLIKMGPVAEEPVLKLLEHENWTVRATACDILAEIGGEKSLPLLKTYYDARTGIDRDRSGKALQAIKERQRANEKQS